MRLKVRNQVVEQVSTHEASAPNALRFELPDDIREQLPSYLITSNESSSIEREIPSMAKKTIALFDYWTFIDILYFHGGSSNFSECHRDLMSWHLRTDASLKQLVLEARGHLKSTLLSVGKTLWRIYQNPNIRILVGTESLKLSKSFIREIKAYLEDDWLQENVWNSRPHISGRLVPVMDKTGRQRRIEKYGDETEAADKKVVWRADAIQVLRNKKLKEPTVTAASVGQTNTGSHVDEVILDDVVTFDNTATMEKIQKVADWVYDIASILDPPYMDYECLEAFRTCSPAHWKKMARWAVLGGRVTVIGTRYDESDYYGYIQDNQKELSYDVHVRNIYKNGVDDTEGYHWPEKWTQPYEDQVRAELERSGAKGRKRFSSQYLNRIIVEEDIVLAWHRIVWFSSSQVSLLDNGFTRIRDNNGQVQAEIKPYICLEPAATVSTTSDFTSISVGGYNGLDNNYYGHFFVLEMKMGKFFQDEWVKYLYEMCDRWRINSATIESVVFSNTLQRTIRDVYFKQYRPLVLRDWYPGNQTSKYDRIEASLYPLLHSDMFHMAESCKMNRALKGQFDGFGKSTVHDDGPDNLQMLSKVAIPQKANNVVNLVQPKMRVNSRHGGVSYYTTRHAYSQR